MSKNSPKGPAGQGQQQPNWWLAGIWALTAFLLFRTCSTPAQTGPQQNPADLYATLTSQNAQLKEVSAGQTYKEYNDALNAQEEKAKAQLSKKTIDKTAFQAQVDQINIGRLNATVMYSDALLRGGEKTGRFDRFQDAYQTLYTLQKSEGEKPIWSQLEVTLPPNATDGQRVVTPAELWARSIKELGQANHTNLVWGFIPGYQLIDGLVHITGAVPSFSYWFAALLLAVLVRGVAWPLSQRQLMFSRQMSQLTPLVKEVQEKYKANDALKNTKTMELYAEYGINPAAGCWPALVQIPLFFAIYQCMLQYRFDFQNGYFLWITPHIAKMTGGFTAPNLGQPDNVLILIYAASMLTSTLLTPVSDPSQVRQQRITGVIVSLLFPALMLSRAYPLPCAFVLYWTFTNILSTIQSLRAYRLPVPPLVKKATVVGGVIPQTPKKPSFWETLQERAAAQLEEKQRQAEELSQARAAEKGTKTPDPQLPTSTDSPSSNGVSTKPDNTGLNGEAPKNGQAKPGQKSKPKRRT